MIVIFMPSCFLCDRFWCSSEVKYSLVSLFSLISYFAENMTAIISYILNLEATSEKHIYSSSFLQSMIWELDGTLLTLQQSYSRNPLTNNVGSLSDPPKKNSSSYFFSPFIWWYFSYLLLLSRLQVSFMGAGKRRSFYTVFLVLQFHFHTSLSGFAFSTLGNIGSLWFICSGFAFIILHLHIF